MKKNIQLSIPSPCQQQWSSHQPTKLGGYCSSCQKEVIDFTGWSDRQIENYFRYGNDNTCGRFREDQLKTYSLNNNRDTRQGFLPIVLSGITFLLASRQAEATVKKTPDTTVIVLKDHENTLTATDTAGVKTVTGIVKERIDQSPIPGLTVMLKNTTTSTLTDADGRFSIVIQDPKPSDTLVFSFIGYQTIERNVADVTDLTVTLTPDLLLQKITVTAGGICVRRSIWWKIKNIFRQR